MERLAAAQFDALAKLLRVRESASRAAARMVLVDGHSQADAARLSGLKQPSVTNAVNTFRRGLELAKVAAAQ